MTSRSRKSRSTERSPLLPHGSALLALFAALTFWACAGGAAKSDDPGQSEANTSQDTAQAAVSTSIRRYVSGASQAVGLAFDSRGRLLYAEKDSGRIVRSSRGRKTVLAKLNVAGGGESGLLGLAVDAKNNVYAYYTGPRAGCPRPTSGSGGGSIRAHCIWSFKPSGGRLRAKRMVFSSGHPSSAENHVGGGLHIGPDDALYLGLGDLGENGNPNKGPSRAQDLGVPFGKILRLDPARSNRGASGNPTTCGNAKNSAQRKISDGRIFACGLRNPYSFDWDSRGRLWAAEAGDSCDEINIIRAGVNYGWEPPRTDCAGSGAGRPAKKLSGTPSGVAIPKNRSADSWRNDVFTCLYVGGQQIRIDGSSKRTSRLRAGDGRCGYDQVARGNRIYMSNGSDIYRLTIRK